MWIDVRIPYEPKNRLDVAYNRAMENTTAEWVLLLDQDVFLCNPLWYKICLKTIEKLKGENVGLISCMTNGPVQKKIQRADGINSDKIDEHINKSREIFRKYGLNLQKINVPITGFFMLVNKTVWENVKFEKIKCGVGKIDRVFSQRVLDAGYSIYLMNGLYVYHRRGLRKLKF
jgi:GT2 family glycosyltransferase